MQNTTDFDPQLLASEILNISGLGILILDDNQKIIWSNGQCAQWLHQNADDLVGNDWYELPFESGDEKGELLCLFHRERSQTLYLQHWQAAIPSQSPLVAHFFRALSPDVQPDKPIPQVAGLPQRPSWIQFLDYEVSRSRRYDNPLALMKLKLIDFKNDDAMQVRSDLANSVSQLLKDELRWADMIGHSQTGEFLLILPETPADALPPLKEKLTQSILHFVKANYSDVDIAVVIGDTQWQKGDSSALLVDRVRGELINEMQNVLVQLQQE